MKFAAALVLLLVAASAKGDDDGIAREIGEALARGDRPAALAALDAVTLPGAARNRRRSVEAAGAAMNQLGGPDGNVRAARILVDALRLDRSDQENAYTLAMGLRARAVRGELDFESAREILGGLAHVYPEHLEFAKDLALAYRDAGRTAEARDEYARIAELAPSDRDSRLALAVLLEDAGSLNEAVAVYDELIALRAGGDRPDLLAHLNKGWLLLDKAHDCARARSALEEGVKAAQAAATGVEREQYLARFRSLRDDIEAEERRRVRLRSLGARLDRVLAWTAAAWLIVLGGGVLLLRRARWL